MVTTYNIDEKDFGYFCGNSANKGSVYIALPNLKSGMTITDWTPAPEDFQTQIDGLKSHLGK